MNLRVHICPVGFEVDRVVLPVIERKADVVWLLTKSTARCKKDDAEIFINDIKSQLSDKSIFLKNKQCDITDMVDSLRAFREIFTEEEGNMIFVNVSSGNKVLAIAGMMACMMWEGEPYYVEPEKYYDSPNEPMSSGLRNIVTLPRYKIDRPPNAVLECLQKISKKGDNGAKKKEVMEYLESVGYINVIPEKEGNPPSIQSKYRHLEEHVLKPARDYWKFITEEGRTRNVRLKLTNEGRQALKIFCKDC